MPPIVIAAIAAGAAGFSISELVSGLSEGSKASLEQPALPDASKASAAAATTVADQRAALLQAGGVTDYTGGLGVLTGSDVSKTTLIGG